MAFNWSKCVQTKFCALNFNHIIFKIGVHITNMVVSIWLTRNISEFRIGSKKTTYELLSNSLIAEAPKLSLPEYLSWILKQDFALWVTAIASL